MLPLRLRRVVNGQSKWLGEELGRHVVTNRFQNLEFKPLRNTTGSKFCALEEARRALVKTVEQKSVQAVEIICQRQRLAHTTILELRLAGVEHKALHRFSGSALIGALQNIPPLECRELVFGCPTAGTVFESNILQAALGEGLPHRILVLNVGKAPCPEIIAPDVNRDRRSPIIV